MDDGKRHALAALWLVVALLMAATLGGVEVTSVSGVARIVIVVLALALSSVYAFDPRGIVSERSF